MTTLERLAERIKSAPRLTIGGTDFHFDSQDLDEFHRAKAERELRETPELVQESFTALCALLAEEEDLYVPLELEFLQIFLRRCKWYPKSAFKLIKRFYEYQQKHPEFYKNLKPSNERAILQSGIIVPLCRRGADGCRLVAVEAGKRWKPKEITLNQIFRGVVLCVEIALAEPMSQVSGVQVIIDMEGLSLSQVTHFTPGFAAAIVEYLQKCMPCRLKGIHIVNNSFIFDVLFAFFKPFIKGKIRDRIFFHGSDRTSMLAHFDAKCLPKKYGGSYNTEQTKISEPFYNYVCCFEEYFDVIGRYGYHKDS